MEIHGVISVAERNGERSSVTANLVHEPNACTHICSRTEIAGRGNRQQLSNSPVLVSSDIFRSSSGPRTHIQHTRHSPLPFLCVWRSHRDCRSGVYLDEVLKSSQDVTAVRGFVWLQNVCVDDRFFSISICMSLSLFLSDLLYM